MPNTEVNRIIPGGCNGGATIDINSTKGAGIVIDSFKTVCVREVPRSTFKFLGPKKERRIPRIGMKFTYNQRGENPPPQYICVNSACVFNAGYVEEKQQA